MGPAQSRLPPAAEDLDSEFLATLALATSPTHREAALTQGGLPKVQLILLEEGRVLEARGWGQSDSHPGAGWPCYGQWPTPKSYHQQPGQNPPHPEDSKKPIPSPSQASPPASWHSWLLLPCQAYAQHQVPPARQSSLHCCGRRGWTVPRRSIPATMNVRVRCSGGCFAS